MVKSNIVERISFIGLGIMGFRMAKKTSYLKRLKFIKSSFDTKEIICLFLINK